MARPNRFRGISQVDELRQRRADDRLRRDMSVAPRSEITTPPRQYTGRFSIGDVTAETATTQYTRQALEEAMDEASRNLGHSRIGHVINTLRDRISLDVQLDSPNTPPMYVNMATDFTREWSIMSDARTPDIRAYVDPFSQNSIKNKFDGGSESWLANAAVQPIPTGRLEELLAKANMDHLQVILSSGDSDVIKFIQQFLSEATGFNISSESALSIVGGPTGMLTASSVGDSLRRRMMCAYIVYKVVLHRPKGCLIKDPDLEELLEYAGEIIPLDLKELVYSRN